MRGGDGRGESKGETDRSIWRYHTASEQSGVLKCLFVSHALTLSCILGLPGGQESLYSMGETEFGSLLQHLASSSYAFLVLIVVVLRGPEAVISTCITGINPIHPYSLRGPID